MFKLSIWRAVTFRAQSMHCVVINSTLRPPACCCCGSHHYGNRIFPHRRSNQVDFPRSMRSFRQDHHQRLARLHNGPTRLKVFPRSLSSESDSTEQLSKSSQLHADLGDENAFEDVAKELDAVGLETDRRKSRKEKAASDGLKESMKSVGRLVPDRIVNLLDQEGESLGSLHRIEAIKHSQQTGLKLVLINPNSKPYPTYRLMTGQQLHREQMLLREKLKAKSAPIQVKETRLSGNIDKHDLEVKRRHVQEWFKDGGAHVHVKVAVLGAKRGRKAVTKEQQMAVINQLISGLEDRVTFVGKPRDAGKEGMNLMVMLRPMSAKEKAALVRQKNKEEGLKHPEAAANSELEDEDGKEKIGMSDNETIKG